MSQRINSRLFIEREYLHYSMCSCMLFLAYPISVNDNILI